MLISTTSPHHRLPPHRLSPPTSPPLASRLTASRLPPHRFRFPFIMSVIPRFFSTNSDTTLPFTPGSLFIKFDKDKEEFYKVIKDLPNSTNINFIKMWKLIRNLSPDGVRDTEKALCVALQAAAESKWKYRNIKSCASHASAVNDAYALLYIKLKKLHY